MEVQNPPETSASPPITGILILDKPEGMSSMQAVARVRHRAGRAKTGHAGTLDPLATGVLVLALGRGATKHIPSFMETDKRYQTLIDLGAFTTTDDREGEREEIEITSPPDSETLARAVAGFVGPINQRPPNFSAIKVGGRRAYKLARQGQPVEIKSRPVTTYSIEIVRYEWPKLELTIHCAKGFYVRSLARDLGEVLGTGGHCLSIRRTGVGPFLIEDAISLDEVPDPLRQSDLLSVEKALAMVALA